MRYSNFVGNGVGVRANSGSVEVSGNRFYGNTSGIYVSGVITENTVWTRSNSPYIVSGHIGVEAGVKLRIESGVRVVIKGRYKFQC